MKSVAELNLADIVARKSRARRRLADMSFSEKIRVLEEMRLNSAPLLSAAARSRSLFEQTGWSKDR